MLYEELKKTIVESTAGENAPVDGISKLIEIIKDEQNTKYPDVELFKKQYNPKDHDVMDNTVRRDKQLREPDTKKMVPVNPQDPQSKMVEQIVPGGVADTETVNRVAIPLQRKIVETRVNFAFGKPVTLEAKTDGEEHEAFMNVLNKILKKNKIDTINRQYAREAHRATRVAECWYLAPGEKTDEYGAAVQGKIRVTVWKPWEGDSLYPFFDDFNDMIAFGRGYKKRDSENREEEHFEVYTVDEKLHFHNSQLTKGWELKSRAKNPYKKIPIVYTEFEEPAWAIVQSMIERMEVMLSDLGDTNQYHASPKIVVKGKIVSFAKKGETGGVLQISADDKASAEYLSWDNAPESLKVEAEMLLRFIFSMTNTPDLSFEQMSKMTNPSGETMKMLFMDALLQVLSDSEKWNDWQERRINLLKVIMETLAEGMKGKGEFEIEPKINPFIIEDFSSKVANLSTATGGAQLMSQETAITMLGAVENVAEELDKIKAETTEADERAIKKEQAMQTSSGF